MQACVEQAVSPLSCKIKTAYRIARPVVDMTGDLLIGPLSLIKPRIAYASDALYFHDRFSWVLFFLIVGGILWRLLKTPRENFPRLKPWYFLLTLSFFLTIGFTVYFSFLSRLFTWYLFLAVPMIGLVAGEIYFASRRRIAILIFFFIISLTAFARFSLHDESQWAKTYQKASESIQKLPADVIVGSWAVGHLGYFSGHRVVNLEGIIADTRIYQANLKGELVNAIEELGINYLAYNAEIPDQADPKGFFFDRLRLQPLSKMKPCLKLDQSIREDETHSIFLFALDRECLKLHH
jgi:hypothetical protein